jgi:hypothetical protein
MFTAGALTLALWRAQGLALIVLLTRGPSVEFFRRKP